MRAEEVAEALGGKRSGNGWVACCPAHDDRNPSLSISDGENGKPLVHCHAGCSQAQVVEALRARVLWETVGNRVYAGQAKRRRPKNSHDHLDRTNSALQIWGTARASAGTLVETYLKSRGITISPPDTFRFHPKLRHPSGGYWPCMVALVTQGLNGEPVAIHRTFLAHDGSGKAPVNTQKMMLGPCRGAGVQLAPVSEQMMIGEGIETCLAVMQATRKPVWAALSTSGLKTLELPPEVREVTILADGDDAGESAARHAAQRWVSAGVIVRIARPGTGLDFNDMLCGPAPSGGTT